MLNLSRIFALFRKVSLAERLAEAIAAVPNIIKVTQGGETYLRIADLADALRSELLARKIIIIPNDLECTQSSFETDQPHRWRTEVRLKTEFTITDGHESIVVHSYGNGQDVDGFALSLAQTFAEKSLLKRLGLIFGENEEQPRLTKPVTPSVPITNYQERAWQSAIQKSDKSEREIASYLETAFQITGDRIADLQGEDFQLAIEWLLRRNSRGIAV